MTTIEAKNRQIIGQIYQEMWSNIYAIFRKACLAEDTCKDLVQDVFEKLLSVDLIIPEQVKALAARMAYQKRTDYLRHHAYIKKVHNEGGWQMEKTYTEHTAEMNDILHVEMQVIKRMSKQDCQVYCLSRFDEKTADEIALTLNLTKRAVEGRLYRSRSLVREKVKKVIGY